MEKGKLIVIEGPDGVGKSSLCKNIKSYLMSNEIKCKIIGLPYKSKSHSYRLLREAMDEGLPNDIIQSLMIMNIRNILNATVTDMLNRGIWVILDRWIVSTIIYNEINNGGFIRESVIRYTGFGKFDLYKFSKDYCKIKPYPDLVMYYMPPRDIVLEHAKRREKDKNHDENDTSVMVLREYYKYSQFCFEMFKVKEREYEMPAFIDSNDSVDHVRISLDDDQNITDEKHVYTILTEKSINTINDLIGVKD